MEMINDNMTQNTDSENQNTDVAESIVEETSHAKGKNTIDLGAMFRQLIQKKKVFFIVWSVVFVLACAWILPQPVRFRLPQNLLMRCLEQVAYHLSLLLLA